MRWRCEKELVEGKGQFMCGEKSCINAENLKSWEVNFGYLEKEEKKNALVKLR
jgi:protein FRA10AC1